MHWNEKATHAKFKALMAHMREDQRTVVLSGLGYTTSSGLHLFHSRLGLRDFFRKPRNGFLERQQLLAVGRTIGSSKRRDQLAIKDFAPGRANVRSAVTAHGTYHSRL